MFWTKRQRIHQPGADEVDVWVNVCVMLATPLPGSSGDGARPIVGYYQNFGVRAPRGETKQVLERSIADGTIDWSESEETDVDPNAVDDDIAQRVSEPDHNGIWYKSGRIFFAEDQDAV